MPWGALVLVLGTAGLLFLGYALCGSGNRTVPAAAAAGFQRVEIGDGTGWTTVAWARKGENGKGIVFAHGNSSTRNAMLPRMRYFHSLGYSVIAPDLRAHGETRGSRKTFGILESKDVAKFFRDIRTAARNRLKMRTRGPNRRNPATFFRPPLRLSKS